MAVIEVEGLVKEYRPDFGAGAPWRSIGSIFSFPKGGCSASSVRTAPGRRRRFAAFSGWFDRLGERAASWASTQGPVLLE